MFHIQKTLQGSGKNHCACSLLSQHPRRSQGVKKYVQIVENRKQIVVNVCSQENMLTDKWPLVLLLGEPLQRQQ